jgi:hypothetical protein
VFAVRKIRWASICVAALAPATAAVASTGRRPHPPDVTILIPRAVARVHGTDRPNFAHARLLEAVGTTRGNRAVSTAPAIASWRFVFANTGSSSRFASVSVVYGPSPHGFGRVEGSTEPVLEDVPFAAPRMTLASAVRRLRSAGVSARFVGVVLRSPLGPHSTAPLYAFELANRREEAVNTRTGKVSSLSS